ncbi:MAG: serine/threonine-protein kinase [Myxococcota bacterium]
MSEELSRILAEMEGEEALSLGGQIGLADLQARLFGGVAQATVIGRFAILHKIGAGGMGSVYAAYDQKLDRRVALKLMHRHIEALPEFQARLLTEAQSMARLNHPNVVQVYDVGDYEGRLFVAMEFVEGQTVRRWLSTPRSWREVVAVYRQAGQGLCAAHERAIIHRDFKPDNVVIDSTQARVRVLDFGLAATLSPDAETATWSGTPAYMSPEQHRREPLDARSDQFSFCVSLYEAITGERPFDEERNRRPLPDRRSAPDWLHDIIERGLSDHPDARWPSMESLLFALEQDPDMARQQRRRQISLGGLLIALCALLVFAGIQAITWWEQWTLTREARTRLVEVRQEALRLRAQGRAVEADAVLTGFLDEERYQPTPVIAQGWLDEAHRRVTAQDAPTAVTNAYVSAYTHATRRPEREAALLGLARHFERSRDWSGLRGVLATMDEQRVRGRDRAPLANLRLRAALGGRDLTAARALLDEGVVTDPDAQALLRALSPVSRTELDAVMNIWRLPTRPLLIAYRRRDETQEFRFLHPDPALSQAPIPSLRGMLLRLPGLGSTDTMILSSDGVNRLYALEGDEVVEKVRWPGSAIQSYEAVDLDRDGSIEHYAGMGYAQRRFWQLWPDQGRITQGLTLEDTLASDIMGLTHADLDQDGTDELIMTLSAWVGFEIRLLHRDPGADALVPVARKKLGRITWTGVLGRDEHPPLVVAVKQNFAPSAAIFGEDTPYGSPPGIYLLRYDGQALHTETVLPAPWPDDPNLHAEFDRVQIGDVDGDGRQDIVAGMHQRRRGVDVSREDSHDTLVIYRQQPDGTFHPTFLGRFYFRALVEIDGDPAQEIVVTLEEDPEKRAWILGAGETDALPPSPERMHPASTITTPVDAPSRWHDAEQLTAMGLYGPAADVFGRLAEVGPVRLQARAAFRAAEHREWTNQDVLAAELYQRAAADPDLAVAAMRGAFRSALRRGRFDEAARHAEALVQLSPEEAQRDTLARFLGRSPTMIHLDFDEPLSGQWTLHNPIAIRRDPLEGSLTLDGFSNGVLAELPVRWSGGELSIDIDMFLHHGEYGGQLRFHLSRVGAEDEPLMSARLGFQGGGRRLRLGTRCNIAGDSTALHEPDFDNDYFGPLRVQMRLLPSLGERSCVISRDSAAPDWSWRTALHGAAPEPGDYVLQIIATDQSLGAFRVDLRHIILEGLTISPAVRDQPPGLAHAMVEGRLSEVLASEDAPPLWRAEAAFRLGHLDDAQRWMRRALREQPDDILTFLRARPTTAQTLLRATSGDDAYRWFRDAWLWARWGNLDDPAIRRALLLNLSDLDDVSPDTGEDAVIKAELLFWRAEIALKQDQAASARRDLEAAIALLPDTPSALRADLFGELAEMEARLGDPDDALDFAQRALNASDTPRIFTEYLRARPAIRTLHEHPRWDTIFPELPGAR